MSCVYADGAVSINKRSSRASINAYETKITRPLKGTVTGQQLVLRHQYMLILLTSKHVRFSCAVMLLNCTLKLVVRNTYNTNNETSTTINCIMSLLLYTHEQHGNSKDAEYGDYSNNNNNNGDSNEVLNEGLESLQLISWYREGQKKSLVQSILAASLTTQYRLHITFGQALYWEVLYTVILYCIEMIFDTTTGTSRIA
jgi:hypothetical protein